MSLEHFTIDINGQGDISPPHSRVFVPSSFGNEVDTRLATSQEFVLISYPKIVPPLVSGRPIRPLQDSSGRPFWPGSGPIASPQAGGGVSQTPAVMPGAWQYCLSVSLTYERI